MRSIVYHQFRKELHIIKTKSCISSLRKRFLIHTWRCDDIQSLRTDEIQQWFCHCWWYAIAFAMDKKIDLFSQVDFLVGAGGYSASVWFRPLRAVPEITTLFETLAVPKGYRAFWAASTAHLRWSSSQPYIHKTKNRPIGRFLFWWERVDSDHRRQSQQIYSLPPLATREHSHIKFCALIKKVELVDGLEPPTCWLQISCSTNWAIPACDSLERLNTITHLFTLVNNYF